jgi:hypothetical protein
MLWNEAVRFAKAKEQASIKQAEEISKTKASMAYNPNNTEGINKKICRRCGYTRKDTLKDVFARLEKNYIVLPKNPQIKQNLAEIQNLKKHFGLGTKAFVPKDGLRRN